MSHPEYGHWDSMSVRWGDMDSLGHVNNAVYFTYFESGRLSYFSRIRLWPAGDRGSEGPILANISCNFRSQLHFPAQLEIGTGVVELRNRSFVLQQAIFDQDRSHLIADGSSVVVWLNYAEARAVPLPAELRAWVQENDPRFGS